MDTLPLSIVIVNWNTRDLLEVCLDMLHPATEVPLEHDIWVVDNGSTDGSVEMVQTHYPDVHLLRNSRNVGYTRANNQAIRASSGPLVLLLNSDALATPEALSAMVRFMQTHPMPGLWGRASCARTARPSRSPLVRLPTWAT